MTLISSLSALDRNDRIILLLSYPLYSLRARLFPTPQERLQRRLRSRKLQATDKIPCGGCGRPVSKDDVVCNSCAIEPYLSSR